MIIRISHTETLKCREVLCHWLKDAQLLNGGAGVRTGAARLESPQFEPLHPPASLQRPLFKPCRAFCFSLPHTVLSTA